jgi:hypothetical protein
MCQILAITREMIRSPGGRDGQRKQDEHHQGDEAHLGRGVDLGRHRSSRIGSGRRFCRRAPSHRNVVPRTAVADGRGGVRVGHERLPRLLVRQPPRRQRPNKNERHSDGQLGLDRWGTPMASTPGTAASAASPSCAGFVLRNQPDWMPLLWPIWSG